MCVVCAGNEEHRSDVCHVSVGSREDVVRAGDNVESQPQRRSVGTGREADSGTSETGHQIQTESGNGMIYYLVLSEKIITITARNKITTRKN